MFCRYRCSLWSAHNFLRYRSCSQLTQRIADGQSIRTSQVCPSWFRYWHRSSMSILTWWFGLLWLPPALSFPSLLGLPAPSCTAGTCWSTTVGAGSSAVCERRQITVVHWSSPWCQAHAPVASRFRRVALSALLRVWSGAVFEGSNKRPGPSKDRSENWNCRLVGCSAFRPMQAISSNRKYRSDFPNYLYPLNRSSLSGYFTVWNPSMASTKYK